MDSIALTCRGRVERPHREVVVYRLVGSVPNEAVVGERMNAHIELHCRYCGLAPRLDDAQLRALLRLAASRGGRLTVRQGAAMLAASPPTAG